MNKGQPVLIGTTSILQSEKIAQYLKEEKLTFEVLNAKTVEQEVQLISLPVKKDELPLRPIWLVAGRILCLVKESLKLADFM